MNSEPTFSVIIPTFNRAHLIQGTISSVLSQSFDSFEIIIVDDGSTDNSEEVIASFSDERIKYFKKENEERGRARNYGIEKSSGAYVTFLDSDDLFYDEHLELADKEVQKTTPVFWSPYEIIDSVGEVIRPYQHSTFPISEELIEKGNVMSCHGVFIRRDILSDMRFSEDRALSGSEDLEFWLRLVSHYEINRLSKVTNALVHHEERSVLNFDDIDSLIRRKELMLKYLSQDEQFMLKFGSRFSNVQAQAYSYIALHSAMNLQNPLKISRSYFWRSLKSSPTTLFRRRTMAILKYHLKRILSVF